MKVQVCTCFFSNVRERAKFGIFTCYNYFFGNGKNGVWQVVQGHFCEMEKRGYDRLYQHLSVNWENEGMTGGTSTIL